LTNGKRADIMNYRINKKHVDEKSKLWKAPERNTFAESISAGSSRRPSPSGPNPVR